MTTASAEQRSHEVSDAEIAAIEEMVARIQADRDSLRDRLAQSETNLAAALATLRAAETR